MWGGWGSVEQLTVLPQLANDQLEVLDGVNGGGVWTQCCGWGAMSAVWAGRFGLAGRHAAAPASASLLRQHAPPHSPSHLLTPPLPPLPSSLTPQGQATAGAPPPALPCTAGCGRQAGGAWGGGGGRSSCL